MKKAIWFLLIIGLFWGCKHKSNPALSKYTQAIKKEQKKSKPGKTRVMPVKNKVQANVNKNDIENGKNEPKHIANKRKTANPKLVERVPPKLKKHEPTPEEIEFKSELKSFKKDINKVTTRTFSKDLDIILLTDKTPGMLITKNAKNGPPKKKILKKVYSRVNSIFKNMGIIKALKAGIVFKKNAGKVVPNMLFFKMPKTMPAKLDGNFQVVRLKKGKYIKTRCSDIIGWEFGSPKHFPQLLQKAFGKKIKAVFVGPAFCMSDKDNIDLTDNSMFFYCRMVPKGHLTEEDRANVLDKSGSKAKLIPSYLRTPLPKPTPPHKATKTTPKKQKNK